MKVSNKLKKIQLIIDKLENAGFECDIQHQRYDDPQEHWTGLKIKGYTFIIIYYASAPVSLGVAYCSVDDEFNKATATKIAFNRAMQHLANTIGGKNVGQIVNANNV